MAVEGRVLGMATSLLGLMLAGLGYSAQQGEVIDRSAQTLLTQTQPQLAQIATVEGAVAQQYQAVETLWRLRLQQQTPGGAVGQGERTASTAASLEEQTQVFWGQGQQVDEAIKAALGQLETIPNPPPTLVVQWQSLERTHQRFQDQSDHLLTLVAKGRWQEAQSLDRTLTQALSQVQTALTDLRVVLLEQAQGYVRLGQVAQRRVFGFQGTAAAIALGLGGIVAGTIGAEIQRRIRYWKLDPSLAVTQHHGNPGADTVQSWPIPVPIAETLWTRLGGFPLTWEAQAAVLQQKRCLQAYGDRHGIALDDRTLQTLRQTSGFCPLLTQAQSGLPLDSLPASQTLLRAKVTGWEPWLGVREGEWVEFGVALFGRALAEIAPELWGIADRGIADRGATDRASSDRQGRGGEPQGDWLVRWGWPLWGQAQLGEQVQAVGLGIAAREIAARDLETADIASIDMETAELEPSENLILPGVYPESIAKPQILACEAAIRHQEMAQALSITWLRVGQAQPKSPPQPQPQPDSSRSQTTTRLTAQKPQTPIPLPPIVTWAIVSPTPIAPQPDLTPVPNPANPNPTNPNPETALEQRSQQLQSLAQQYGVAIVLDQTTRDRLPLGWETRRLTLSTPTALELDLPPAPETVYELLGRADRLTVQQLALRDLFEKGLRHCQNQDWKAATAAFAACLVLNPDDRPSQDYAQRIAARSA